MHEGRIPVRVVLGQGEGGAGDRFADAAGQGQTLHQRGLACPQGTLQQQNRALGQASCQLPPEGASGLKGLKSPDMPCRVRRKRARSLGVSAEIQLHDSLGSTETMVAAPTSRLS